MQPSTEEVATRSFDDNKRNRKLDEIKSQKNLGTIPYLEDNADEAREPIEGDERKHTEIQNLDMRQTYTKPRIPKRPKLPWHDTTRPLIKELKEKPIKLMIQNNQYRQTQEVLPPLPAEDKDKSKESKESKNPFMIGTKYKKIVAQMNTMNERNKTDLQECMKSYKASMNYKFILEEFIMLEYIKSAQNTGPVKKILHLPTFKLYAAKEEPVNNKQSLSSLKEWVASWQSRIAPDDDSPFLKIISVDWKRPEGYITIITEYAPEGSLQNLLDSVGSLPENAIQQVCLPVLKALNQFYTLSDGGYGSLSPSQIIFTDNLQIKLGLGLAGRGSISTGNSIYHTKLSGNKPNVFDSQGNGLRNKQLSKIGVVERSLDTLKLGIVMLRCAVGSFQMFQQCSTVLENVQMLVTEQGQKIVEKENLCCVIHSEEFLMTMTNDQKQTRREALDSSRNFHFSTFLRSRYSSPFINFLCICLQLSNRKRATISDLLTHSFAKFKFDPHLVKVTLEDLHKVTRTNSRLSPSIHNRKINRLVESIQSSVRLWKRQLLPDFKLIDRTRIRDLAEELGISEETLQQKINMLIQTYPDIG